MTSQNEDIVEAMEGVDDLGDVSNQSVRAIAKLAGSEQVLHSVCVCVCGVIRFVSLLLLLVCCLFCYHVCCFIMCLFLAAGSAEGYQTLHGRGEKMWK